LTARLLRAHVGRRPHDAAHFSTADRDRRLVVPAPGERFCQPEVEHFRTDVIGGPARCALQDDVGRLQVAMDDAYQIKPFSRSDRRVLMRLDPSKLDLKNPRVHRTDNDFAVAWAKMYGKGRVFYTTLGHVEANWDKPEMQAMVTGAIKWALGLVEADITPRPAPQGGR
jgi:hypothetical protein